VVLIWMITALQIRGARLTGLTTNWISLFILIPLGLMAILGIWNWIQSPPTDLPFMPPNTDFTGAFSLGLFVVMWNYMGFELATVAGDEIVNPKKTYPIAMGIVLVLAIATYLIPVTAGLYGGAGEGGRYLLWGTEATGDGATIGTVLEASGVDQATIQQWGVDPAATSGWYLPDIAQAVGDKTGGPGSGLGSFLGAFMTIAAALGMVGLFIGNSLGASRIPFALSEDGMMPTWLVRVSPRYGTPWVAIIVAGVVYSIFASNAFAFLVVADVLLNMLVLIACFLALWRLRFIRPDQPRKRVPGGYVGLALVTLGPIFITVMAVYSQWVDVGSDSITLAVAAIIVGALLYIPIRRFVKPGIPDIDPFQSGQHTI
jgi:amino acid transporter